MPRNGSGVYSKPAGTTAAPNTTIESAKYNSTIDDIVDDLNAARPATAGGTGQTSVPAARQAFTTYTTKSAGYTAAKTDAGAIHRCSAEITVSLTAATTLGANWTLTIIADGGSVTIDADGTELINGEATLVVSDGDAAYIICTGSAFVAITIPGVAGVAKLDTVNTFTKTQVWSKGADVASAAALTLGDDGNYFDVTGTTAITSIATVGVGTVVKLHFDGALTLTHHSTDLVLPGGANITTAAGDEAEFVEYDTGKWRCTNYQVASISPALPLTAMFESAEQTITAAGLLTLAHGLSTAPKLLQFFLVCKTAEAGYSVGDVVVVGNVDLTGSTATTRGLSARVNATNVVIRFADQSTSMLVVHASNGSGYGITNANWRLIVRAWA